MGAHESPLYRDVNFIPIPRRFWQKPCIFLHREVSEQTWNELDMTGKLRLDCWVNEPNCIHVWCWKPCDYSGAIFWMLHLMNGREWLSYTSFIMFQVWIGTYPKYSVHSWPCWAASKLIFRFPGFRYSTSMLTQSGWTWALFYIFHLCTFCLCGIPCRQIYGKNHQHALDMRLPPSWLLLDCISCSECLT